MANPEHLEILEQGKKAWNEWQASAIQLPDLSGVVLPGKNLSGMNFRNTMFVGADLQRADLRDSVLKEAFLGNANLSGANLSGVDMRFANLMVANLTRAQLANADFWKVEMGKTIVADVDLSEVKYLETVIHHFPSTVGIDTVYNSRGKISEEFLRGCGVPEDFVTYMRSLTMKAIEFYSCFISYSSRDEEFARRLHNDLQSEGVRCWFAPEDLKIGEKFRVRIDESIRLYDKLLLVLSESSVASRWVEKEVETAFEKEGEQGKVVLFPVRLDDAVLEARTGWAADVRRSRHIGDFREWKSHDSYRKAFERLMRDLKAEASR